MNMTSESTPVIDDLNLAKLNVKMFSCNELAAATNSFNDQSIIGEGNFGPVFKGKLEASGQLVAVKVLNPDGLQGNKEFTMEVQMLSRLHHPNLIDLIGYCIDGERRLLVYEFMPLGSLQNHLHEFDHTTPELAPLDWNTRMIIAHGVAKALDYLHNEARPPVIYRDLKPDNILLGEGFNPKISDFGIAMFVQDNARIFTDSIMGKRAYSAPEFCNTGGVTTKSDVYSFGVVLLELFTGLRALDVRRENEKYYLADWVHYKVTNYNEFSTVSLADPRLSGDFPKETFCKMVNMGLNCTEYDEELRPSMKDVVWSIDYLKSSPEGESSIEPDFVSLTETKLGASVWGRRSGKLNKNPYEKQGQSE